MNDYLDIDGAIDLLIQHGRIYVHLNNVSWQCWCKLGDLQDANLISRYDRIVTLLCEPEVLTEYVRIQKLL